MTLPLPTTKAKKIYLATPNVGFKFTDDTGLLLQKSTFSQKATVNNDEISPS